MSLVYIKCYMITFQHSAQSKWSLPSTVLKFLFYLALMNSNRSGFGFLPEHWEILYPRETAMCFTKSMLLRAFPISLRQVSFPLANLIQRTSSYNSSVEEKLGYLL